MSDDPELVATILLRQTIGAYRYRQLRQRGYLTVKSKVYECTYRVARDMGVQVWAIDQYGDYDFINDICIVPRFKYYEHEDRDGFPTDDVLLCQWLLCKYDEKRLWKVGRRSFLQMPAKRLDKARPR